MGKLTQDAFVSRARLVHGEKYDYSKTVYTGHRHNILIVCPEHGEFVQNANSHLRGRGCPKCGQRARGSSQRSSINAFIQRARAIHGDKYDYSKSEYLGSKVRMVINCPEHGQFIQTPNDHLSRHGCPKCGDVLRSKENRLTVDSFIEKARTVHGDTYDYSAVNYVDSRTKIEIICKKHGSFFQEPSNHLSGSGCILCARERSAKLRSLSFAEFSERGSVLHNNKYVYSDGGYDYSHSKAHIICPEHGEFVQSANSHLSGHGCPKCGIQVSKGETELLEWIQQYFPSAHKANRLVSNMDIDVYIPEKKIGIEYNGVYWHSEKYRKRQYHLNKLDAANKLNIRLMQFWDFEWENKKDIVKSIILNALGIRNNVVYARDTELRDISSKCMRQFCDTNHLQGFRPAHVYKGLYHKEEIVAAMAVAADGELVRYVVKCFYCVPGAFSRLLKHLSVKYSFVDRRIFTGSGYLRNGFVFKKYTDLNYFYIYANGAGFAGSRLCFQKHKLKDKLEKYDPERSEIENMHAHGFLRVFDCGNILFTLNGSY